MIKHVLVVDNDPLQSAIAKISIEKLFDCRVTILDGGQAAIDYLLAPTGEVVDVMLLDVVMPEVDGFAVLRKAKTAHPQLPVIMYTAHGHVEVAVQALSQGAVDFVEKQDGEERLEAALRNAERVLRLRRQVSSLEKNQGTAFALDDLIGTSASICEVKRLAKRTAGSEVPVCIEGESGVGKTQLARAIHAEGKGANNEFYVLNCRVLSSETLEKTLLGDHGNAGKFTDLQHGTLCLESLDMLDVDAQAVLINALNTRVEQLKTAGQDDLNFRIIATVSSQLRDKVKQGEFREDLYYMVNVFPIHVPALRERCEDIADLIDYFVEKVSLKEQHLIRGIEKGVKRDLCAYAWPGNVRQLYNAVQRAVVVSQGEWLSWSDFSHVSQALTSWQQDMLSVPHTGNSCSSISLVDSAGNFQPMSQIESDVIALALHFHGWNISKTAKALDIGRSTLYRKMTEYGLEEPLQQQGTA